MWREADVERVPMWRKCRCEESAGVEKLLMWKEC